MIQREFDLGLPLGRPGQGAVGGLVVCAAVALAFGGLCPSGVLACRLVCFLALGLGGFNQHSGRRGGRDGMPSPFVACHKRAEEFSLVRPCPLPRSVV